HNGSALQEFHALDDSRLAVELDVCTEAGQLLHVHEAILEDGLGDARLALGLGHQRHELRLQVRGEAGERLRRYIDSLDARTVSVDTDAGIRGGDFRTGACQNLQRVLK